MTHTMDSRARELGLRISVSAGRDVPAYDDPDGWGHDEYRVRLTRPAVPGRSLTVTFRKGYGHNGSPPTLPEVLDSLVGDASDADETFEEWCGTYGYDTDSRRAEATWKACRKVRADLTKLIGADALETLTYDTERL